MSDRSPAVVASTTSNDRPVVPFALLTEDRQVGRLVNAAEPHLVDCTPRPASDDSTAAVIRVLQFNTWYRTAVLVLTLASIALGVFTTWLAVVVDVQEADCDVVVPAGEDASTFNTPCASLYCNREQCCSCSRAPGDHNCSDAGVQVCKHILMASCDFAADSANISSSSSSSSSSNLAVLPLPLPSLTAIECYTEYLNGGQPNGLLQTDAANLAVLVLLLVDLTLCLHFLSKNLCYCRCCLPCVRDRHPDGILERCVGGVLVIL
jgi:hypothetical protein